MAEILNPKFKFAIEDLWRHYCELMSLPEEKMHEDQKRETKRAFYGGVGQVLAVLMEGLSTATEDEGSESLAHIMQQVQQFFVNETAKQGGVSVAHEKQDKQPIRVDFYKKDTGKWYAGCEVTVSKHEIINSRILYQEVLLRQDQLKPDAAKLYVMVVRNVDNHPDTHLFCERLFLPEGSVIYYP